ncbi:MAG: DUF5017 domain-containing protein [Salinivirgaceae bacterium]|nr:DUF5017 domain-containing protein [Salinivirgaceae bacterium]
MKKFIKYFPIVMLFMWSCNPMQEVYDELDTKIEPYKEDISYTLTSDDYKAIKNSAIKLATNNEDSTWANAILSDLALNQKYSAMDFVAPLLAPKFPALKDLSTCMVTYNLYEKPEYLIGYEAASKYKLTASDYTAVGGDVEKNGYFFPSESADKYLPGLLADTFPNAIADQYAYVTYNQSDTDPIGSVVLLSEEFNDYEKYDTINKNGWMVYSETGSKAWQGREFNSNRYAQASAYGATGAEILYMITPAIDLSTSVENNLTFDVNVGYWTHVALSVLISDDLNGTDVENATWYDVTNNFTLPTTGPADGYGAAFVNSGNLLLNDFTGTIHVAFRYTGDGSASQTTTYQVDNVVVKGIESTKKSAKAADYLVYNDLYKFNGTSWVKDINIMALDPADYILMGISGFSSSNLPNSYLPSLLRYNIPVPAEGKIQVVVYEYSSNLSAREYQYSLGYWNLVGFISAKSDQFTYADNGWAFNPAVKFFPTAADYQLLVDYVYKELSRDYGSSYGNDEFYFGASAYYLNFDLRLSNRTKYNIPGFEGLDNESAIDLTWQRVEEGLIILLTEKFPEAVPEVGGIEVEYWLSFNTYENDLSKKSYTGIFVFTNEGGFVRDTEKEDNAVTNGQLTEAEVNWNR